MLQKGATQLTRPNCRFAEALAISTGAFFCCSESATVPAAVVGASPHTQDAPLKVLSVRSQGGKVAVNGRWIILFDLCESSSSDIYCCQLSVS